MTDLGVRNRGSATPVVDEGAGRGATDRRRSRRSEFVPRTPPVLEVRLGPERRLREERIATFDASGDAEVDRVGPLGGSAVVPVLVALARSDEFQHRLEVLEV